MFKKRKAIRRRRKSNSREYNVLEPRNLLAGITLASGVLQAEGGAGNDRFEVSIAQNGQVTARLTGFGRVFYNANSVSSIEFNGYAGNDTFINNTGMRSTVKGGVGNDIFIGGSGFDTMLGGNGADRMYGNGGNDIIDGGSGSNSIFGGGGNDKLTGGNDADMILGGSGNDNVFGNGANDVVDGGDGNDTIRGNGGNDTLIGGFGVDILLGGTGADSMSGSSGNDRLDGGSGDDTIRGQDGDDFLLGRDGADVMDGGSGDDQFYGGAGNDTLLGQNGNDVLRGETGNDVLIGGNQDDNLFGENGSDILRGGWGHDVLSGGNGADELYGEGANDTLRGGSGNDLMLGGAGNDSLDAGTGTDVYRLGGNLTRFNIAVHTGGSMTMIDNQSSEGRDTVHNTERIRFNDGERVRNRLLARDLTEAEKASRTLLNQLRASVGRGPVNAINDLSVFAESWSRTMSQSGFRHSPRSMQEPFVTDGRTRFGENIAFTSNTNLSAQQAASYFHNVWRNSADHYPNMVNADYTEIGIGIVKLSNGWWATHNFSDLH